VAEGLAKNSYNSLRGIKDWRTDDANGEQNDLPSLSKGKLKDFFYIRNLYGNIEDVFNRPVYSSPEDWIDVAIREPESTRGFFSKLVTTPQSRRCLNLGSYNYLGFGGLNTHCTPLVVQSVLDFPITSGSCSAELGYSTHVKQVEETTARFVGKESAVVVGMGFATNSTVIPALCGAGDLILSDALNHNSIVEGARLSGAKIKAFKHNCVGDLELLLQQAVAGKGTRYNKILVIVEGIYSMEGELCALPAIVEVC
jgi:serine palmitoyltransferase